MTLDATFTDATITLGAGFGEVQTVQTVKPIPFTSEMTQPVGIAEDGKLYTFPTAEGKDGFSPIVKLEHATNGVLIKVTDKDGITAVATVTNGKNGKDGVTPQVNLHSYDDGVKLSVTTGNATSASFIYNGRSAYQFAQDAGYTGTEEEFAKKLAEKTPTALPNPKSFTFMDTIGTVDYYNGSQEKTLLLRRVIYVTLTLNGDGSWSASEDFQTIATYCSLGWTVFCVLDGTYIPLLMSDSSNLAFAITLAAGDGFLTYAVTISSDNSVWVDMIETTSLPNPNSITINGNSYNGSEEIDFTDTINGMIDAKLGVIENGSY